MPAGGGWCDAARTLPACSQTAIPRRGPPVYLDALRDPDSPPFRESAGGQALQRHSARANSKREADPVWLRATRRFAFHTRQSLFGPLRSADARTAFRERACIL